MSERFEVVDEDCIGCGLCSERAPANLEIPSGARTARVFKQPETSEEEQACLEACDYCPMAGIKSSPSDSPSTAPPAGGTPPPSSIRLEIPPVDTPERRLEN